MFSHTKFIHVISAFFSTVLHDIVRQITKNKFPVNHSSLQKNAKIS